MRHPSDTTWPIAPHTAAKHAILRAYLDAWLPIMTAGGGRTVYLDGFAGPGRYTGGEDGSPIVALRAALEHRRAFTSDLVYFFVEERRDRAEHLRREAGRLALPPNVEWEVREGRFADVLGATLDELAERGQRLAPTFALVDPCGWSDVPLALLRRLLAHPKAEVLVTFMFEEVNRFLGLPEHGATFDGLFGTTGWREIARVREPAERRRRVRGLYEGQLVEAAGAKYVATFEMRNARRATDYFLFFATRHPLGLARMKAAMARVDRSGGGLFSDAVPAGQMPLFESAPDPAPLVMQMLDRFGERAVRIEEVDRFAAERFSVPHYKRLVLAPLERQAPPALEVIEAPPTRRPGTYPPGTVVRFLPPEAR